MSHRHCGRTFSAEFYDAWKQLRDSYPLGIPKSVVVELFRTAERHLRRSEGTPLTISKVVDWRKRIVALALDAHFPKKAIAGAVGEVWGYRWRERLGLQRFDRAEPMIDTPEEIASTVSEIMDGPRSPPAKKKLPN